MAERAVNVVNPKTGEKGSVPESKLARALATGSRKMTDAEKAALLDERAHDGIAESFVAQGVGNVRGFGEALGAPLDPVALGVADAFGKREETQKYLADLRQHHPIATGIGEMQGQGAAMVAAGEVAGGEAAGARASSVLGRIGSGTARAAARGGVENVIIGSSHDVNEVSLGNPDLAGQKLYTRIPKHFMVGAAVGGGLGFLGSAAGEVARPIMERAPGALDRQASAAIGRELGESGEGAVRLGEHVRGAAGGIPRDGAAVADIFAREQAGYRGAANAARAAEIDALERAQTTEAWRTAAKQEAGRKVAAEQTAGTIESLKASHNQARETLAAEHKTATEAVQKLTEERAAHAKKLSSLATELDKVKGAELPNGANIVREATERFGGDGASLTPPSENALRVFGEWADTFGEKYSQPGALNFSELRKVIDSIDTMQRRQRVVSGWGNDPDIERAFAALKQAAHNEFDRASAATASTISEASSLNAERLRALTPELDTAYEKAFEHATRLETGLSDFERRAAQELSHAERLAERSLRGFEKRAGQEAKFEARRHASQLRAVPKAGKGTPVDDLLGRARASARKGVTEPSGAFGGIGALLSLAHGNIGGAVLSAAGGFAAHAARAQGNYLAAKAMRALGEQIASVDAAIARGAARALGRGTSSAVKAAARQMVDDKPKRKPTFEQVAKRVRDAQANPLLIDNHVRASVGQWAPNAPQVYASVQASAMRAQAFLASKLPQPQKDPFSMTPQLEDDDLSDTDKHEFMQYVDALSWEPGEAYERVLDGTLTEQHVEAIKTVLPPLYEQMRAEVDRQTMMLQKPIEYERAIHIGTLLEKTTDEVLDPSFQRTAMAMYAERAQAEEIDLGSRPKGRSGGSSMMTTSQRVEEGEMR